jgi:Domain of unknown function (DUF4878)
MMKTILPALFMLTCILACNRGDSNSPTAAIDGIFNAMKKGDVEEVKKYISSTDVAMLEAGERMMAAIDPEGIKKMKEKMIGSFKEKAKTISFKLKNEKINGDRATVDAEITDNGKSGTHTVNLVKEDGSWKVAISKSREMFNSMKGDMGRDRKGLEGGLEKLKSMPPDSIQRMLDTMKSKMKIH